jgi:hypothetical protein
MVPQPPHLAPPPAGVFSAGVPAHFHANYQAALRFVDALEAFCTVQAQVCAARVCSGSGGWCLAAALAGMSGQWLRRSAAGMPDPAGMPHAIE